MPKAGAVKYPCGLIGSYNTVSVAVLVLQKGLSTSVKGKSYNQLADLQASLTICAVVLILGWLTNYAERFLAYFCSVSLTANVSENVRRMTSEPPTCQHFGIKAKAIFFWDPVLLPIWAVKVKLQRPWLTLKGFPQPGKSCHHWGGKSVWETDWHLAMIFLRDLKGPGCFLFFLGGHRWQVGTRH